MTEARRTIAGGDKIEPALTEEEWTSVQRGDGLPYGCGSSVLDELSVLEGRDIPAAIAYLNSRLPDNDPRKITRKMVTELRDSERALDNEWGIGVGDSLGEIADALESYLPPESG